MYKVMVDNSPDAFEKFSIVNEIHSSKINEEPNKCVFKNQIVNQVSSNDVSINQFKVGINC